MPTCTRRLQFCAGHRVYKHESKCKHIHGHNYVVFITAEAPELDSLGRVIDFSVIKEKVGGWINKHWDHGMILCSEDPLCELWGAGDLEKLLGVHKWYQMASNPTAENMAKLLLEEACPNLFEGSNVTVTEVTLWETENCYATARLDDV